MCRSIYVFLASRTTKMAAQGQSSSPEQGQNRDIPNRQKALRVWSADRRKRKGAIAADFTNSLKNLSKLFFSGKSYLS